MLKHKREMSNYEKLNLAKIVGVCALACIAGMAVGGLILLVLRLL